MGDWRDVGIVFGPGGIEVRVGFGDNRMIGNFFQKVYYKLPGETWQEVPNVLVQNSEQAREAVENFLKKRRKGGF